MNRHAAILLLCLSLLFLALPIWTFVLWIKACNQTSGYPANQELFRSWLPPFLKDGLRSSLFSFLAAAVALLLAVPSLRSSEKPVRVVALMLVIVAGLMVFANLWSMM